MGVLASILALLGSCSPKQEKDEVLFHMLYFKDVEGTPELWEVHKDYFRYQDPSQPGPSMTVDAPLDEQEQKALKEAFNAVPIDSLKEYYKGPNTDNAPGLVFRFYPGTNREKTVQLRAFRHDALLKLFRVINDRSAFPADYLEDLVKRENNDG